MTSWFPPTQSTAAKGGRWDGFVWHSHQRPTVVTDFYRSPEWRTVRAAEIAANKEWYGRDTPTCERCGVWGTHRLVVRRFTWFRIPFPVFVEREWHGDHIDPRSLCPERELDPENVQILCQPCNSAKSNRTKHNWKAWRRRPLKLGYPRVWITRWHQRTFLGWSA